MSTSAFAVRTANVIAPITLLADEGWVMGDTGNPIPDPVYLGEVTGLYLQPSSPLFDGQLTFPGFAFQGLTTPEQFCPIVCLPPGPDGFPPNLNFGDSVLQGATDMNNAVIPHLQDGDNVAVFGYSQSGTVATQAMTDLLANADKTGFPTSEELNHLSVVTIADPNGPIGGILDRYQFPEGIGPNLQPQPQHLPFLNVPLGMAPTPTSGFDDSAIYTGEYDGWGNWPQDQLNILGLINAAIGIDTVHPYYPGYSPAQLADTIDLGKIGDTNFYMIPENLPILQFMFNGGTPGQFFGDFFSPWARLFIDWGYGNAGDPAVDGLWKIPAAPPNVPGADISGSPYEQAIGVAGGSWAETPLGQLYGSDGTLPAGTDLADFGVAGLFEKMDPLQMLAGLDNALVQSLVGPWADVAASTTGGVLTPGAITTVNDISDFLQTVTGYDLINSIDSGLLTVWNDVANAGGLGDVVGPDVLFDGPAIPGQGLLSLVGVAFDAFNVFGA